MKTLILDLDKMNKQIQEIEDNLQMFKQKDMDFMTEFQNAFVKNKDSTNQLQQL